MLTEQQPLQTTHSQLSLNGHLWDCHKVSILGRCPGVRFTEVSINRGLAVYSHSSENWTVHELFARVVYVVVQFYPWFKFYFSLFQTHYHTLPYPKTKGNKI